jgi:hypothetical protein
MTNFFGEILLDLKKYKPDLMSLSMLHFLSARPSLNPTVYPKI